MKHLLALLLGGILAGAAFADTTVDLQSKAGPLVAGQTYQKGYASGVAKRGAKVVFKDVTASSFSVYCCASNHTFVGSVGTSSETGTQTLNGDFIIKTIIGNSFALLDSPVVSVSLRPVASSIPVYNSQGYYQGHRTEGQTKESNVIVNGLSPNTIYWIEYSLAGGSYWTSIQTLPLSMIIGPVTTVSSFTGCVFSVPVTQIGTGNESVQIDIVVTGPDGSTHSATKTVTESGTVAMTIDDPPLLAGANYTAVVTVTMTVE